MRVSDSPFFCSAVKTEDKAATAAARCDPWPDRDDFDDVILEVEDGLNADDSAAKADALCVGPSRFTTEDLDCSHKTNTK